MVFWNNLIVSFMIILSNIIILLLVCFLGIKFSKIRVLDVIYMRQYFYTMLSTVTISCLLPTIVAAVLYIVLFFLYKRVLFRNYAFEIQRIYLLYGGEVHRASPIQKFSCVFKLRNTRTETGYLCRDYQYTFSKYLNNTIYIFVFYCIKGMEQPTNAIIYGLEFFVAMTALFVIVSKLIYNLALTTPSSLFFLSPTLAYLPVVFSGVLFYGIAILIFITTL